MTAAIIHVGRNAAYAIADRGSFDDEGRMIKDHRKLTVSDRLKIALAMQGPISDVMHDNLRDWLDHQPDQATMLATLPDILDRLHGGMIAAQALSLSQKSFRPVLQLYVACWSEARQRAECYVMASAAGSYLPERVKPLELYPCVAYVSPEVPGWVADPNFCPHTDGLRLVEAQRHIPDDMGRYIVGGAAELATIDAKGVRITELVRWPDRLGRNIDPGPALSYRPGIRLPAA